MKRRDKNKVIHSLFEIGLIGKALDGMLEVVGGSLLFLVNPDQINGVLRILTEHELSEDPHDLIAGPLVRSARHLTTDTKVFAATFLLWHGAVKLALVWSLLRKRWWAYPIAIAAFGLFLAYQVYRFAYTRSTWLLALSLLDLFVIVITWLEYKRLRAAHELRGPRLDA
ncbi:DUF2127 domain-containing protein [Fontivita pretiosa]|uniref:DUF2127 domain-containing protein n=1 Tax=Fontivita pretiosa TaxID=2989684 RepID=UPI003D1782A0